MNNTRDLLKKDKPVFSARITDAKSKKSYRATASVSEEILAAAFNQMINMGMTAASIQGGMVIMVVNEEGAEPNRENDRLEDHERGILWHAIGMTTRNYRRNSDWWSSNLNHRNNYCLSDVAKRKEIDAIGRLVHLGLMKPGTKINDGKDQYFHVTYAGIKLAREEFFRARQAAKA